MQPVTIKSKQYINSLWMPQICLMLLAVTLLFIGVVNNVWFLILLPLSLWALSKNHQTIQQQASLQLFMRANGQLVVIDQSSEYYPSETTYPESKENPVKDDNLTAEVLAFWHIPHILMLKVKAKQFNKPINLTVFRAVIGAQAFSHLLVGLTQLNVLLKAVLKNNHDQV